MKKFFKSYRFALILLLSMLSGSILGIVLKDKASILKPFGDVFVNMLYTIVVPLVFFTISSSIAAMTNLKRLGKILKYVFIIFIITSAIAAIVMLVVLKFINPMSTSITLEHSAGNTISIGEQIVSAITVNDFYSLLSKSHMLPLIIFSILFGIGVSLLRESKIKDNLMSLSKIMLKMINIIMYYAPIGLCAYFAALIGEFGPNLLGNYAKSMAIFYILSMVYFIIFYTIYAYISGGKEGVKIFYKHILEPLATSLSTQSSLASLPTNIKATHNMDIPNDIKDVALPLGATMHMEGSSIGAILKIVFLFAVFNKTFVGINTYLIAIAIAILSAVVMSGIPGGGLIGEMLIVSIYGFPLEAFPIIATIGWLIDPPATALNVCGDVSSCMLISRVIEGKKWYKKNKI